MARDIYTSDMFKMMLGKNIKHIRLSKNMSLDDVAKAANCCKSHIWNIENGLTEPSISKALSIAKALEVDINSLIS